ncbi:MAG: hypothetical protein J0G30_05705 [Actinomycetales bacterium]|nr:hypothetical protein [Actinomycetales bacterium]
MTTLRVVVDDVLAPATATAGRIARAAVRALSATAPAGAEVIGMVAASPESDYARLGELVPGLAGLEKHALARRELAAAWSRGLALPRRGAVHAPGLLAPLRRHDRLHDGDQLVVTIADAGAWTHPDLVADASWTRRMATRAERFADAVIAPTHAVADALREHLALGDRVRVVPPVDPDPLPRPADPDRVAERLGLPERYLLLVDPDPVARERVAQAIPRLGESLALVVADASVATEADLAVMIDRAGALVHADAVDRFAPAVRDALAAGTLVVAVSSPSVTELLGDAVETVPAEDEGEVPVLLAAELDRLLGDPDAAARAAVLGEDRSRAFDGRDAGRRLWELHAAL